MQKSRNFKKRYLLAFVLVVLSACAFWQIIHFSPFEEDLIRKIKINSATELYVTESSAGATTGFVYKYYLVPAGVTDSDFQQGIEKRYFSFLSTSDKNAQTSIQGNAVYLTVKGDIWHFSNLTNFATTIHLTLSPY
ncbi:hypothetical protein [Kalamiella sp. sgz302252]|uniref:hypothetical protein n=1 Tax=Pantoea sp. sgz302252 TaxID=3341827 RepID=UPI0036D35B62